MNAKQNAEKRYQEVLKREGLLEDDLVKTNVQKHRRTKQRFHLSEKSENHGGLRLDDMRSVYSLMTKTNSVSGLSDCYDEEASVTSDMRNF